MLLRPFKGYVSSAQEGAPSSKKIFNLVFVFQDFWFDRRPFIGELTAVIVI